MIIYHCNDCDWDCETIVRSEVISEEFWGCTQPITLDYIYCSHCGGENIDEKDSTQ